MMILHYLNGTDAKPFDQLYIVSQVGAPMKIKKVFQSMSDLRIVVLDEEGLVSTSSNLKRFGEELLLSDLAAPVAAACSLAE